MIYRRSEEVKSRRCVRARCAKEQKQKIHNTRHHLNNCVYSLSRGSAKQWHVGFTEGSDSIIWTENKGLIVIWENGIHSSRQWWSAMDFRQFHNKRMDSFHPRHSIISMTTIHVHRITYTHQGKMWTNVDEQIDSFCCVGRIMGSSYPQTATPPTFSAGDHVDLQRGR